MYAIVRAAGFAAAAFGAASFPAYADPLQAFGLDTQVTAPVYSDHAVAMTQILPSEGPAAEPGLVPADAPLEPLLGEHNIATPAVEIEPEVEEKPAKRSLLALVGEFSTASAGTAELECLAGAIYFESKGEPLAGQLAVAEVIINRSRSGRYPASLCGVVKQRGQFSFVRGGRMPPIARDSAHWRKAVAIAHIAVKDLADSPAENALSFHATYVSPRWRMKRVATVGNHIFYR